MLINSPENPRIHAMRHWLVQYFGRADLECALLAGDASFRRYYRVYHEGRSYVVMDAPPDCEPCGSFIKIAQGLKKQGVPVPEIHAQDEQQGFLLLTDGGDQQLLSVLTPQHAETYYRRALGILIDLQRCSGIEGFELPHFDVDFMRLEMDRTVEWYFEKFLQHRFSKAEEDIFSSFCEQLMAAIVAQPTVFMHRDYHSRNLLVQDNQFLVLDFQDAMWGPLTYDAVSLLRDCYITWPHAQAQHWAKYFYERSTAKTFCSFAEFLRWFDWMGVQRHVKCLGIFARLVLHFGKKQFLTDIPRTLGHILAVTRRYPEFESAHALFLKGASLDPGSFFE